ncbi:MAG: site-2 protease family protein [Pseudomonadota bacterium]|nr:site-2 protease family protein [Pseudomonadota bacterium]
MDIGGTISDALGNFRQALPVAIIFLVAFVMRWPVTARRSIHLSVPVARAFGSVDLQSPEQVWHRPPTRLSLHDDSQRIFRAIYAGGPAGEHEAYWKVVERQPDARLVIDRHGIAANSTNNELMRIVINTTPENEGARLAMEYHWGPRPLLAQLLARLDLGQTLQRIKAQAEGGDVAAAPSSGAPATVALVTAALSFGSLVLLFGWLAAALVLAVLAVHELGHLLAFRILGQPWGRVVFIPFVGAIAVPRQAFRTLGHYAFASLAGPGLSLVLLLPAFILGEPAETTGQMLVRLALISSLINLLNLLPVMPFDGGHVVKAVCQSIGPGTVKPALVFISVLLFVVALLANSPLLLGPALVALVGIGRMSEPILGMRPMDVTERITAVGAYVATAACYSVFLLIHFGG